MGFNIQPVAKTRKFGGKVYKWWAYEAMRTVAFKRADALRLTGISARVVAQPGYGQGGWNIYIRERRAR